ncbi:trans-aconitate 2-methyltransferase [Nocardioides sp. R-C-SC26]|uniref:class I SAM-dependent methyltransferase n=1 Tax=Nocardioides sp. R-C-SC26 TaxID=2870414 RepID=UPI001E3C395D|nr:class I SAM-dependent methyltransferase [Nocardioides sp. R-C-SC26]
MSEWQQLARRNSGDAYARQYADRFARLEREGHDIHGEARFVRDLRRAPARVLDAGCGTGRIAARLAADGYDVLGVDADPAMIDVAREDHPDLPWQVADLAALDLGETFDVVLLAGNVVPFLHRALDQAVARLAAHVAPGGLLAWGFGTDAAHLPPGCPVVDLAALNLAVAAAGLHTVARHASWDGEPYEAGCGYVVAVMTAAGGSDRVSFTG